MKKTNFIILFFIFLLAFFCFIFFIKTQSTTHPSTSGNSDDKNTTRNVYIGFWTHGFWDDKTKSINPGRLREIENKIGKKVAIANYFRGWQHLGNEEEIVNEINIISSHGWMPMVSTNPYFFSECPASNKPLYRALADGECDVYLHKMGKTLQKIRSPFFFRFAWEMNVDSMEWSIIRTGSTPKDFIDAWRHLHEVFKEEGVKSAKWVFSPQIETPTTTNINQLYPGKDFVDWVGLDGYNWGITKSWSKWQSFHSIFLNSYKKMREIAPDKPLMIAEVNTVSKGGNQAEWYKSMLADEIPKIFKNVDAIIFFNEDKTSIEGVKWLIDSSSFSLDKFRDSIQNPIYKSELKYQEVFTYK